jgi:hypothetical protein
VGNLGVPLEPVTPIQLADSLGLRFEVVALKTKRWLALRPVLPSLRDETYFGAVTKVTQWRIAVGPWTVKLAGAPEGVIVLPRRFTWWTRLLVRAVNYFSARARKKHLAAMAAYWSDEAVQRRIAATQVPYTDFERPSDRPGARA